MKLPSVRWRQRLAYAAVVAAFAGGMWRVEAVDNQREEDQRERDRKDCRNDLAARQESKELLIQIVTVAGARERLIGIIEDSYEERPDPATCEPR